MTDQRRMGLGALTDVVGPERVIGIPVGEVTALAYDSRAVAPGTLFFAVPGVHVDGHEFAAAAVEAGAIGLVVERELPGISVPQLVVDRTRRALADAADEWFGRPSEQLTVIGVTGTDGKSTVTALTAEMLWGCRWHPGQIGTVFTGIFDDLEPNLQRNTTPEALELQELLARMVAAGNDSVVMEATSHGLALERTRNSRFDVGVVTTVTSEHLEFHGTLENYRAAKARLVEEAPIAVLNAEDASFGYFRERARDRVITYGIDVAADLRAGNLEADATGTRFHLESPRWHGDVRSVCRGASTSRTHWPPSERSRRSGSTCTMPRWRSPIPPACRDECSAWMPASRSPSSSTTRTRPTRCARCSRSFARWQPAGSSWSSDRRGSAIPPSARRWAVSRLSSPTS